MIVKWTYFAKLDDGTFSLFYYFVIIVAYCFHQVSVYSMFVAAMSFHARISGKFKIDFFLAYYYVLIIN